MNSIRNQIEQFLKVHDLDKEELATPPKPEMGDFALPCFTRAKLEKKNPATLANEIAENLQKEIKDMPLLDRIEALGPYVNFFLHAGAVADFVLTEIQTAGAAYGTSDIGKGKEVMVEYPSQNSHKEFHIGHLRNAAIGNTLVALYRATGHRVIPVNYINDFGAHVVKCLWGIRRFHPHEEPKDNPQRWLGEVYTEAHAFTEEHPEAKKELEELQVKFEARDPEIWPLFLKTRQWSVDGFEKIHQELGVEHDAIFFESDVKDRGQEIVEELLKKGIAKPGERGAIIIDLGDAGLETALLRKATGAGLYLTSDLALAEKKFANHHIQESMTITGLEQNFYFKQLFEVLRLNGFASMLTHIGYGLVNLPEGKMSSRKGNVILYETLRDQIFDSLLHETKSRHADWSHEKSTEVAHTLTQAALKFSILKHEVSKNMVFDIDESVSVEGFSGPYVLYAIARMNSLLKKAVGIMPKASSFQVLTEKEEKTLLLLMDEYGAVVKEAQNAYNPSRVTRYAFDLAKAFNDFYAKHRVVDAENTEVVRARLALIQSVKQVLTNALSLLTIRILDEM